jgi:hypothetical protein
VRLHTFLQTDLPRITGLMKTGSICYNKEVSMILRVIGTHMHTGIDKEMVIGNFKT